MAVDCKSRNSYLLEEKPLTGEENVICRLIGILDA